MDKWTIKEIGKNSGNIIIQKFLNNYQGTAAYSFRYHNEKTQNK